MKTAPLGSMRDLVSIQSRTLTPDTFGGQSPTWTTLATVSANVMPLTSRELWQAAQVQSDATLKVTIRYYAGLTPKHQLLLNGSTVLNIRSVVNPDGRQRFHELLCVEVNS